MTSTKGSDYEAMCYELVAALSRGTSLDSYVIRSGARNRIVGASGYKHQIDISLSGENRLFIIELKCLEKSIGVAEMLVLAARLSDIAAAMPENEVLASIVSTKRPSRNVSPLATHFGLRVEIVESLRSYGLSFAGQHFIGHTESASAQDSCSAQVVRGNSSVAEKANALDGCDATIIRGNVG